MSADVPSGPKVAIMQPYFLPSMRYFQLLAAADIFVFFDDVQFVTKRWTHRNRLVAPGGEIRFTVPLSGRTQNAAIGEIRTHVAEFARFRRKFLITLTQRFGAGPGAALVPEIEALLSPDDQPIATLSEKSVLWAAAHLNIRPRTHRSSDLDYDRAAGPEGKILSLCRALGAGTYVNPAGGRDLYEEEAFAGAGIGLRFLEPEGMPDGVGEPSIVQPLLEIGPDRTAAYLPNYRLTRAGDQ